MTSIHCPDCPCYDESEPAICCSTVIRPKPTVRAEELLRENYEMYFHLHFSKSEKEADKKMAEIKTNNSELRSIFGIGEGA